jgi:hypothetical protein
VKGGCRSSREIDEEPFYYGIEDNKPDKDDPGHDKPVRYESGLVLLAEGDMLFMQFRQGRVSVSQEVKDRGEQWDSEEKAEGGKDPYAFCVAGSCAQEDYVETE